MKINKKIIYLFLIIILILPQPIRAEEDIFNTTITLQGKNIEFLKIIQSFQMLYGINIYARNTNNPKLDVDYQEETLENVLTKITKLFNLDYIFLDNQLYIDTKSNIENKINKFMRKLDKKYIILERLSNKEIDKIIKNNNFKIDYTYINDRLFLFRGTNQALSLVIPQLIKKNEHKIKESKYHYIKTKDIETTKKYLKENYPEIKILNIDRKEAIIINVTEQEKNIIMKEI
jgi:hypothetical protein